MKRVLKYLLTDVLFAMLLLIVWVLLKIHGKTDDQRD